MARKDSTRKAQEKADQKGTGDRKAKVGKAELAALMKKIDFCMMTTVDADGELHSRPMSNNRRVDWDGDTWFFAFEDSSQVQQILRNPMVNLAYAQPRKITFVSLVGAGEIVRDDAKKKELWQRSLKRWFTEGWQDPKVVLIKVKGKHASYWGMDGDAQIRL